MKNVKLFRDPLNVSGKDEVDFILNNDSPEGQISNLNNN